MADMAYQFPAPLLVTPEDRMKALLPMEALVSSPDFRNDDHGVDALTASELGTRQVAVVRATRNPVSVSCLQVHRC